jgi:hypothetical protein
MSDTDSQGTNNPQQGLGNDNQSNQGKPQSYGTQPVQRSVDSTKPLSYGTDTIEYSEK